MSTLMLYVQLLMHLATSPAGITPYIQPGVEPVDDPIAEYASAPSGMYGHDAPRQPDTVYKMEVDSRGDGDRFVLLSADYDRDDEGRQCWCVFAPQNDRFLRLLYRVAIQGVPIEIRCLGEDLGESIIALADSGIITAYTLSPGGIPSEQILQRLDLSGDDVEARMARLRKGYEKCVAIIDVEEYKRTHPESLKYFDGYAGRDLEPGAMNPSTWNERNE